MAGSARLFFTMFGNKCYMKTKINQNQHAADILKIYAISTVLKSLAKISGNYSC